MKLRTGGTQPAGTHSEKHTSFHRICPCTPSIRKLPSGGRRSPPYGLQVSEASRRTGRKTGEEEYLFLGNSPIISRRLRQTCGARHGTSGKPGHHLNEEAFRKLSGHRRLRPRQGQVDCCRSAEPFCPPYSRECLPAPLLFPVWGMTAGWDAPTGPSTPSAADGTAKTA